MIHSVRLLDVEVPDCIIIKEAKVGKGRLTKVESSKNWEIKSSIRYWKINQGNLKTKTKIWMLDQIVFMVRVQIRVIQGTIALKVKTGAKVKSIRTNKQFLNSIIHLKSKTSIMCIIKKICFQIINLLTEIKIPNYVIIWAIIR